MDFTTNITPARFKAKAFYLVAKSYVQLKDGPVNIITGPGGSTAFAGTLISCNYGRQGLVNCPELYIKTSADQPLLPIQLHDQLCYNITHGSIRILSIRRASSTPTSALLPSTAETTTPTITHSGKSNEHANTMESSIPAYLFTNKARINSVGPQALPSWNSSYNVRTEKVMARLCERFPSYTIQRADVVALYKEWRDPELALIATMIWGGIKSRDLLKLLAHGSCHLISRMCYLRRLVHDSKLKKAFLDCCRGGNSKFEGVDVSFFTKILFFMGQANPDLTLKPLILDRWTANAFCLCILQLDGLAVARTHFRLPNRSQFNKTEAIPMRSTSNLQAISYLHYVNCMNSWARELGTTPDILEQFVFGTSRRLRAHRSASNPRVAIIQLLKDLLPPP